MLRSAALTLLLLGDLNFTGLQYMTAFQKAGYDPAFSFQHASSVIQAADLAVANLEGPFTFTDWSQESEKKKWRFRQLPLFAKGMKTVGIDVVLLGNNHIADAGEKGIQDTIAVLREEGLSWVPSPREGPLKLDREGMAVELWNVDVFSRAGSHPWALDAQDFIGVIAKRYINSRKPDAVIAFVHGHFSNKETMEGLASRLRSSGVDWVIFGGMHTPSDMFAEQRGGVHYGLGDFVFGCECSGASEGKMLTLEVREDGVIAREQELILGSPVDGFITRAR